MRRILPIARYFDCVKSARLTKKPASAMTARSCIFPRKTLAISTDTLVRAITYPDIDPADLAYKVVRRR